MPLSEKQLAAAHRLGQDVCVVAGPGSGKTSVLIERFSWLVRERAISPNRILAITFTEKAATEIKQRMVKAFENMPEHREQIERAYVSTIHAFCARLLRENAIEAGIDPQFEVLDWFPAITLLHQAADETLEELYEKQPVRVRSFLRSLAVATERDFAYVPDLATSLIEIYNAMRIAGVAITPELLRQPDYSTDLAYFRDLLREVANENPHLNTSNQRQEHAKLRDWALDFLALPQSISFEHFQLFAGFKFNKSFLPKNTRANATQDMMRELRDKLHGWFLLENYGPERELILESLSGIDVRYRASKRRRSGLDFDDLEEDTIHLLESDPQLRRRIQESFDFILMDELQDTNPLQWKLLSLIRRRDNFFAVGDVNQSIFAFRHAEPALFHGYRQSLAGAGKSVDELRDNYRSRSAVLDTVNRVFAGPAPGLEAHNLLASSTFADKPQRSVEVIAAFAETNEEAQRLESLWVARRILDLVGRLELKEGTAKFRDIAILTRANAATAALQTALDEFKIPSLVLGGLTFFDTREVRDLVLLLSVLVNPCNEIALAGLLRSPMFGLSDEDLFRLRLGGTLSEAVEANSPPHWNTIQELRAIRNAVSPDRLLRRVIDESGYESGLSSRARANIDKFLSSLRTRFEKSPAPLAQILDEIENAPPDAEAPPSDFGDAVRLMTIHKSKGLEFPIVFLPYLHTRRPNMAPIITYSHEYGLGVTWRDPATRRGAPDAIHTLNKQRAERVQGEEENRLLYVGMTRAKEHMVASFSVTKHARGEWAALLRGKLELDCSHASNEPVECNELRLLTVDQPPDLVQEDANVPLAEGRGSVSVSSVLLSKAPQTGQYDSAITATGVSAFAQCPRKYYLSRYLGIKDTSVFLPDAEDELAKDAGEIEASELGNQVHAILANKLVQSPNATAVELADVFRTSGLGKQAARAEHKEYESEFLMAIDDVVMRGQIDLWFEHNRKLILVDYKTDQVRKPIEPERIRAYELQLQIYAMAIERMRGKLPDHAYLHFLRPNEIVEVDLRPLSLHAARETVLAFRAAQESLDFPLRTGSHCFRCAHYKNACPAGREAQSASGT